MPMRKLIVGLMILLAVGVGLLSYALVQGENTVGKALTFSTAIPTTFTPNQTYFCNSLVQQNGLTQVVTKASKDGDTSPAQLTLKLLVQTSPDTVTRTVMVDIYRMETGKEQLNAQVLVDEIEQVEGRYPCASS